MMRGLLAALGLFTILPAPVLTELDRPAAARAMRAFPLLGLLLGAAAGCAGWAVLALSGGATLAAIVTLCTVAGMTGAMHLDGIADTADGLGSRKDAADALVIMKKSDIGPMGVATLVLVLLLEAASLAHLPPRGVLVVVVVALSQTIGRLGALEATRVGVPSARPGGFGDRFAGITPPVVLALEWILVLALCGGLGWLLDGWSGAVVLAGSAFLAGLLMAGWRRHVVRRLGGITGDVIGSVIEVGAAAFLVLAGLGLGM